MELLTTANTLGGEFIASICLFFTVLTTIGTFSKASILQRLQRTWAQALYGTIIGTGLTIAQLLSNPNQKTIFFNISPFQLLAVYMICITLLSSCAFKVEQKYGKRKT